MGGFFTFILYGLIIFFLWKYFKNKKKRDERDAKIRLERINKKTKSNAFKREAYITKRLNDIEILKQKLLECGKIKIIDVSDYKQILIENSKIITDKGGDLQLHFFLKLDSFLKDFEITTKNDIKGIDEIDLNPLILRTHEEAERVGDIEKIAENLDDAVAKLEGRNTKGFDAAMDRLLESVENIKPSFESQIKTLEFYKNMGVAMFLYYISDDKIRYFEIFEAFDKLGVFDSYWQKNILNKLDSIETRLTQINNQMNTLNNNFVHLINLSETMVGELKSIDRSIATNNLLLSITAYQTWRINKNTKSIK